MSFSSGFLHGMEALGWYMIYGPILFVLFVFGIPFLEFWFAYWIDVSYGARFWVIFLLFSIPTVITGIVAWGYSLIIWGCVGLAGIMVGWKKTQEFFGKRRQPHGGNNE